MSKKNNTKKKTAKKQVKAAPDKKKIAIIALAALVVAAAVALAVYFVTKDDGGKPAVTEPIVTVDNGGSQYTYAEYKGTKMPVEFVEILNQAELDSAEMCKEYGVALEVGDREISMPEFLMYYYDAYIMQYEEANYSLQQTGQNRTGYDTEKLPGAQKHLDDSHTWEEQFTLDAIDAMTNNYSVFELALEAGTELSVMDIATVLDNCDMVDERAEKDKKTPEAVLANIYCNGLSPSVYKAREIMVMYAYTFENNKFSELLASQTQADIENKFKNSEDSYSVVNVRVYPIEGEYNEAEALAVSNEKQFLEYAQKNYPYDNYDAEFATQCGYITKEKLSSVYGDEVGAWAFEKGRKKGDVSIVEGMLFRYLVYMDTPAFLSTSCNVMTVSAAYDTNMTQQQRDELYKQIETGYNEWRNGDATQERFFTFSNNSGGTGEETVRLGEYHFEFENWMFDPERKNGDSTIINSSVGVCAIYYIEKNEDDFDWENNVKQSLAQGELDSMYEEARKEYEAERKNPVLKKAYNEADKSIERHRKRVEERKNK